MLDSCKRNRDQYLRPTYLTSPIHHSFIPQNRSSMFSYQPMTIFCFYTSKKENPSMLAKRSADVTNFKFQVYKNLNSIFRGQMRIYAMTVVHASCLTIKVIVWTVACRRNCSNLIWIWHSGKQLDGKLKKKKFQTQWSIIFHFCKLTLYG